MKCYVEWYTAAIYLRFEWSIAEQLILNSTYRLFHSKPLWILNWMDNVRIEQFLNRKQIICFGQFNPSISKKCRSIPPKLLFCPQKKIKSINKSYSKIMLQIKYLRFKMGFFHSNSVSTNNEVRKRKKKEHHYIDRFCLQPNRTDESQNRLQCT